MKTNTIFLICSALAVSWLFRCCFLVIRRAVWRQCQSHRWQHPIVINIQLHLASSRREDCTHSFRCTCYLPHSVCSRLSQLPFSVSSLTNISLPDDLFWSLPHAEMAPEQLESNQAKLTDWPKDTSLKSSFGHKHGPQIAFHNSRGKNFLKFKQWREKSDQERSADFPF